MNKTNKNSGWKIFLVGFLIIAALMVISNWRTRKGLSLTVANNKGTSCLQTVDTSLVVVFQDGQVCVWDWKDLSKPCQQFKVFSDRAVFFAGNKLGATVQTAAGSTLLTVYDLSNGKKQREIRVGSTSDEVWPAVSPDRKLILIARQVSVGGKERFEYEFMRLDLENEILSPPAVVSIAQPAESIVDFAVTDDGRVIAGGIKEGKGRLLALSLDSGRILWERSYDDTKEFCSVFIYPANAAVYAGNRDGALYRVALDTGEMQKKITLLREGETRTVTNDVSVLNLSGDKKGQYIAATITPVSYIIDARSDTLYHRWSTAHRLSSKIVFSPDNQYVATSDIRAGWPIDIWDLKKFKK